MGVSLAYCLIAGTVKKFVSNYFCIPESFNPNNISHQLFDYIKTFVNL